MRFPNCTGCRILGFNCGAHNNRQENALEIAPRSNFPQSFSVPEHVCAESECRNCSALFCAICAQKPVCCDRDYRLVGNFQNIYMNND